MGYDADRFFGDVPHDLLCSICLDVMKDPKMLKTCEHAFCNDCIALILDCTDDEAHCPIDRTVFNRESVRNVFPFFVNILGKLQMKCDFFPECNAKISLEKLEKHLLECPSNPLNNITCEKDCKSPLTLATLDTHDCVEYFKTTIKNLQEENARLRKQLEIRKPCTNINIIKEDASEISINYLKYGSDVKSADVRNKLNKMTQVMALFKEPKITSDTWLNGGLYKLLSSFVDHNENAVNILKLTDVRCLYNYETRLNCFSNVFNKTNSALLIHLLMFDILEPLLSSDSSVLVLDFIEFGVTQLLAQKVRHVTTVANPKFIDNLLMKTAYNFSSLMKKIHYIPFKNHVSEIIDETISGSLPSYDYILSFSSFSESDIKHLLRKLSPFGLFLGFDRRRYEIKKCRLESNTVLGIELISDSLAKRPDFEAFNLIHTATGFDNLSETSKASEWSVAKSRRSRSRVIYPSLNF